MYLPGQMSSYIWSLKAGDKVTISGPLVNSLRKKLMQKWYLSDGGAGMAPMRSHIFDQLKRLHSKRKMSFWYGARSKREIFYQEDFDQLQAENPTLYGMLHYRTPCLKIIGPDIQALFTMYFMKTT